MPPRERGRLPESRGSPRFSSPEFHRQLICLLPRGSPPVQCQAVKSMTHQSRKSVVLRVSGSPFCNLILLPLSLRAIGRKTPDIGLTFRFALSALNFPSFRIGSIVRGAISLRCIPSVVPRDGNRRHRYTLSRASKMNDVYGEECASRSVRKGRRFK